MNQELYANLLNACALFAIREQYDSLIREQLDIITKKTEQKMLLLSDVQEAKKWNVDQARKAYEKAVQEDIAPTINQANADIEMLSATEERLWEKNQFYLEFLPIRYRTEIATSFMLSAVKNSRADTLKEAINLYENTIAQWKLEKILSDAVQMQRKHFEYMTTAAQEIAQNQQILHRDLQDIKYELSKTGSNY